MIMLDDGYRTCHVDKTVLIAVRNALSNLPEYPQLSDIMECINEIDQILKKKDIKYEFKRNINKRRYCKN